MTPLRLALLEHDLLDPDDALDLRQRLAARPAPPRRPAPRRTPRAPRRAAWRLPPPAMGWPARLAAPAVLGSADAVRVGDRFQILLEDRQDAAQCILVVLCRVGLGDWEVRSPRLPGRLTPLSKCRKTAEGSRQIDLLASGPTGRQRWAIALIPAPLPVDFSKPAPQRWADIQQRIARGEVSVSSVDIDVIDAA